MMYLQNISYSLLYKFRLQKAWIQNKRSKYDTLKCTHARNYNYIKLYSITFIIFSCYNYKLKNKLIECINETFNSYLEIIYYKNAGNNYKINFKSK